jgi:hypothetical protein
MAIAPPTLLAQTPGHGPIRSSAAYAEVLLRRTELLADLEALAPDYTEVNPKIVDLRFEVAALDRTVEKLFTVRPTETAKLTAALGKLLVRRAMYETDLARLSRSYSAENVELKRARRRLEIFDSAVKEILK